MRRLKIDGNGAILGLGLSLMVWLAQYVLASLNEVTIIQFRYQSAEHEYLNLCDPDSQTEYSARQVSVLLTGRQNIEKLSLVFQGNSEIEKSCLLSKWPFASLDNPLVSNTDPGQLRHAYTLENLPSGTEFIVVAVGSQLDKLEAYINSTQSDFSSTDRLLVSKGILLPLLVKNREQVSISTALISLLVILLLGLKFGREQEK